MAMIAGGKLEIKRGLKFGFTVKRQNLSVLLQDYLIRCPSIAITALSGDLV